MDGRRSSRRVQRLLVRIHSAENLRHASSQGTYCKASVDNEPLAMSSNRSSLKRLLSSSSQSDSERGSGNSDHGVDLLLPRIYKTQVQKAMRSNPVWREKFELPVYDAMNEVLNICIKSARLMTAPSIGTCSIPLRDVPTETTADEWINLFDNSRRPVGRLRIQMRLVHPSSSAGSRRGIDREHSARLTMPLESPVIQTPPTPQPTKQSASTGNSYRQSTPLSQSLMDARGSSSTTTTTSDSIVSDCSNGRISVVVSNNNSFGPESLGILGRSSTRDTTASRSTTGNEELDFLASKYMNRQPSAPSPPPQPTVREEPPVQKEPAKDDRSPRTTNTTTGSSDDDEPSDLTVEFEFDTGQVRPSTRLPSQLLRLTSSRSSVASSIRADSENEMDGVVEEEEEEESDSEPEDDELDPDSEPDGPRMVLRPTVTKLLRRRSVNVIMDVDEEDEDDDDMFEPFVYYEELPILDYAQWRKVDDIDCTDR